MVETMLDVNGILSEAGCSYDLSTGVLAKIGKKAAEIHLATHGRRPDKQPAEVYSKTYNVYHYREEDRWMIFQAAATVLAEDYHKSTGCQTTQFNTLLDRLHKMLLYCSGQTAVIIINKLLEEAETKWNADAHALLLSTGMESKCAKSFIAQQEAKRAVELICEDIGKKTTQQIGKTMLDRAMKLFALNGNCPGTSNQCGNHPGGAPCYHPIVSIDDTILAAWILEGFCPCNILYITLAKQIKLWLAQYVRHDRELFDKRQQRAIWRDFGNWLLGRRCRKSRDVCVYRELQRRMQPSLN